MLIPYQNYKQKDTQDLSIFSNSLLGVAVFLPHIYYLEQISGCDGETARLFFFLKNDCLLRGTITLSASR